MAEISFDKICNLLPNLDTASDLERFLSRADLIHTLVSEASKLVFLQCVKACCCAKFKIYIEELDSWDLIKNKLTSIILPHKCITQILTELLTITQKPNEDIKTYHYRIAKKTKDLNHAYKITNSSVSSDHLDFLYKINEKNSLVIFIKGIKCKNLKCLLKSRDFESLSDIYSYARIHEAESEQVTACDSKKLYKCDLCFRAGHLSEFCRYIVGSPINRSGDDFVPNQSIYGKDKLIKKPIYNCKLCSRTGHLASFCRYPKTALGNTSINHLNRSSYQIPSQCVPEIAQMIPLTAHLNTISSNFANTNFNQPKISNIPQTQYMSNLPVTQMRSNFTHQNDPTLQINRDYLTQSPYFQNYKNVVDLSNQESTSYIQSNSIYPKRYVGI